VGRCALMEGAHWGQSPFPAIVIQAVLLRVHEFTAAEYSSRQNTAVLLDHDGESPAWCLISHEFYFHIHVVTYNRSVPIHSSVSCYVRTVYDMRLWSGTNWHSLIYGGPV
jgi:hypothetical protein